MLADLVRVPVRAIRHWHRKGHLDAQRNVGRLPYFDFEQVRVAHRLAELLSAGCSLSQIDRSLDELARLRPEVTRPLADASVVVVGRRLYIRRGDQLAEPSGQLLIDFDVSRDALGEPVAGSEVATIPIFAIERRSESDVLESGRDGCRRWPRMICGRWPTILKRAASPIERSRCIGPSLCRATSRPRTISSAELLYRNGDLAAARERYYAAIELDEDYVEAAPT